MRLGIFKAPGQSVKERGFTIVELLVVIVIIGILATITIVAYNGIRKRAQTTAIISAVRQYATIFEQYAVIHGRMPSADWACIGGDTGLPAENGYEAGYCFKPSSSQVGDHPSSQVVEDAIAEITPAPPSPIIPEIEYMGGGYNYRGIIFDSESGTNNNKAVIEFFVSGVYDVCPIGTMIARSSQWTRCDYPLSTNSH